MCLLESENQMSTLRALRKPEPGVCYWSEYFGLQVSEKSDKLTLAQTSYFQTLICMQVTQDLFGMQFLIQ